MDKRKIMLLCMGIGILFLFVVPVAHASFSDWMQDMLSITGFTPAATQGFNATIDIGNTAPVCGAGNMSGYASVAITEAANTKVYYLEYEVLDADGADTLTNASANANFTLAGQPTIYNMSCQWLSTTNSTAAKYECGMTFNYSAPPGVYTVTVGMADSSGSVCTDNADSFTLSTTTSFTTNLTALTFPSVGVIAVNTLASNDPILLNNTGNKNSTNVKVNATDLRGITTDSDQIGAKNFTVATSDACDTGTAMVNMTPTQVTSSILYSGQPGVTNAVEALYVCLEDMLDTISIQGYSTNYTATNYWIVSIV